MQTPTQHTTTTRNIKATLSEYAAKEEAPESDYDFKLLKIDSYVKDHPLSEFEYTDKSVLQQYLDKSKILNEHIEFNQVFTIAIFKAKKSSLRLKYKIVSGEFSTNPKMVIHNASRIPAKENTPGELLKLLFREINRLKAYHGFVLNIFDEEMKVKLRAFVKYIYAGKFQKSIQIPLFEGVEPTITRAAKLIYWYKEKNQNSQVLEVEANETLIEYKKAIFGKNGFNAFGKYLDVNAQNNQNDLTVGIDEASIKIKEDDDAKLYISKTKGYLQLTSKLLSVSNQIVMDKISRVSDSVASEEDNNIKVVVSQHDTDRDSIGEGVELVSDSITVNGHIGAQSKLEAVNLQLDGATHKDSIQIAKHAKINRHKGTLRCHSAHISLLEGGTVHATEVTIDATLGGTIYAQDVTIGHVKSNLKVYASNSITIRLVTGEDNLFKINYRDIPILSSKMQWINKDIDDLKFKLEDISRHSPDKVPDLKKQIKVLENEKLTIANSYIDAKISIEQPFRGLNSIVFTVSNSDEIVFKTASEAYEPFHLDIQEDKITLIPTQKSITLES